MIKPDFANAKTKAQISCAVIAQLISAFIFATRIVQFIFFLNLKFQAFSHLQWLYMPVCVKPGRKSRKPVLSRRGSFWYLWAGCPLCLRMNLNIHADEIFIQLLWV